MIIEFYYAPPTASGMSAARDAPAPLLLRSALLIKNGIEKRHFLLVVRRPPSLVAPLPCTCF